MAGEAKTTNFMLGTATVMIGKPEELYDLNPEQHSVGLVKNFTIESQKESTDLPQGRTNEIAFSITTGSTTRGTFEMYEYTEQNLAYALGLDGGELVEVTGDAHVLSAEASFASGTATLQLIDGVGQNVEVGNTVSVRDEVSENIVIAKVTDVTGISEGTATTATIELTIPDSDSTQTLAAGSYVSVVNVLDLGSTSDELRYAAKVIGQLANGIWVTFLIPKFRVSSGLTMAFGTDNFGNIPFEFTPIRVNPTDPYYAEFKGKTGKMLKDSVKAPLS